MRLEPESKRSKRHHSTRVISNTIQYICLLPDPSDKSKFLACMSWTCAIHCKRANGKNTLCAFLSSFTCTAWSRSAVKELTQTTRCSKHVRKKNTECDWTLKQKMSTKIISKIYLLSDSHVKWKFSGCMNWTCAIEWKQQTETKMPSVPFCHLSHPLPGTDAQ